jgi:hypothetical protein
MGQMTFPCAARAKKQSVFVLSDEAAGGEIKDQTAIHLRVEGEIEVIRDRQFAAGRESQPVSGGARASDRRVA